jgi:hypothetical protein
VQSPKDAEFFDVGEVFVLVVREEREKAAGLGSEGKERGR